MRAEPVATSDEASVPLDASLSAKECDNMKMATEETRSEHLGELLLHVEHVTCRN